MSNRNLVKTVVVEQVFAGNSLDVQIETLKEKTEIITFQTVWCFASLFFISVKLILKSKAFFTFRVGERALPGA